ncbi:MAG: CoA transferase subunit A [Deltaproteobacteria bacterium]|nr:CoA transferase subunit A [Deltaproteobacteria bacterium]
MRSDKLCSMREALQRFVPDGASVVLGTPLESLLPFAAGHELIRQGRRGLTVIAPVSDILFDQLIGAGCVARVIAAWVGNVIMGSAYNYRRAVEQGIPHPIEVEDHSNLTLALALHAAALGVPSLPTRTALGSDLLQTNRNLRVTTCPFTGEPLVAVRALHPDVSVLQVQRCDADGNAHVWGNLGVTLDAAHASRTVILVTEEVVPTAVITSDPGRPVIPGFLVSAVVHERWAAHPSPVQGYYNRDHDYFIEYHHETATVEGFQAWLGKWVLGVPDRQAYLTLLPAGRLEALRVKQPAPSVPVDYGY